MDYFNNLCIILLLLDLLKCIFQKIFKVCLQKFSILFALYFPTRLTSDCLTLCRGSFDRKAKKKRTSAVHTKCDVARLNKVKKLIFLSVHVLNFSVNHFREQILHHYFVVKTKEIIKKMGNKKI